MKPFQISDFKPDEAWILFRIDSLLNDQPIDIYILALPSGMVLATEVALTELSQAQTDSLIHRALGKCKVAPKRILFRSNDPAEPFVRQSSRNLEIIVEVVPLERLEGLISPVIQSFPKDFFSPSAMMYAPGEDGVDDLYRECHKKMIPDSYEPCPCGSGMKYKYCCKRIFVEITHAMTAAENGKLAEALNWIAKAKAIVGETAEVICRESIVYSFFDMKKSDELLDKCLAVNSNHPRAHYLRGISLKDEGHLKEAVKAYKKAIANYPPTDHYHLNEVYNNLGVVYHEMRELKKATAAWEQALLYMPTDKVTIRNLLQFGHR